MYVFHAGKLLEILTERDYNDDINEHVNERGRGRADEGLPKA